MATRAAGLSARKVETEKEAGLYGDGGGLYLQVTKTGAKSWIYRFSISGRRRDMGLGSLDAVSLAVAREKARAARELVEVGQDPIEAKAQAAAEALVEAVRATTFDQAAEAYVEAHKAAWRSEKHAAQWPATLKLYASPLFGHLPVSAVDTALVMKVLDPIWSVKSVTASRLRGRIEAVLDWATVRGHRSGENPARWKGHLQALLPAPSKVAKTEHHAALPYAEISAFMSRLRATDGTAARALRFLVLTAARTGEVLGARWSEIDLEARVWIVPGERMKAGREHRVPLSAAALALLRDMLTVKEGDYVFSGRGCRVLADGTRIDRPLSGMALLMCLRRMKRDDLTAHGFRSTFRDWIAEQTNFSGEVAEMALAHVVSDKVEAAYRRGDLFEKRRALAEAWATYCETPAGANVVTMNRKSQ